MVLGSLASGVAEALRAILRQIVSRKGCPKRKFNVKALGHSFDVVGEDNLIKLYTFLIEKCGVRPNVFLGTRNVPVYSEQVYRTKRRYIVCRTHPTGRKIFLCSTESLDILEAILDIHPSAEINEVGKSETVTRRYFL